MTRTPDTDPARALGYAITHVNELTPEIIAAALGASGVTAEHDGIEHPVDIAFD